MRLLLLLLLPCVALAHESHSHYPVQLPAANTLQNAESATPPIAKRFAPLKGEIGISWDDTWLYIESDGLPSHPTMAGIKAWQQQVPVPHNFTGKGAFRLPLQPSLLKEPSELTLIGPIAIAVNGIPIFHALTQSGKDAYAGGELDQWGGHCGRADDYHYHIAPAHLEAVVGKGNPVAYGLDGYPIYVVNPAIDKPLDECHGYFDDAGNYRYVGELKPPYVMSKFRGEVDLSLRPPAQPLRPHLQPLRGAEIVSCLGNAKDGYLLTYRLRGKTATIAYSVNANGSVDFVFTDPDGTVRREHHERRQARKGPPREGGKPRP
ncbi:MAG: hypothetical protein ACI8W8_001318, partial [Rhodothermales bacterium]